MQKRDYRFKNKSHIILHYILCYCMTFFKFNSVCHRRLNLWSLNLCVIAECSTLRPNKNICKPSLLTVFSGFSHLFCSGRIETYSDVESCVLLGNRCFLLQPYQRKLERTHDFPVILFHLESICSIFERPKHSVQVLSLIMCCHQMTKSMLYSLHSNHTEHE